MAGNLGPAAVERNRYFRNRPFGYVRWATFMNRSRSEERSRQGAANNASLESRSPWKTERDRIPSVDFPASDSLRQSGNPRETRPVRACKDRFDALVESGCRERLLQKVDRTGRHAHARDRSQWKSRDV